MDYQHARRIRKKSLLSLISEQKFGEGKSLTSSVGGAISQKFKARAKGIKEGMDPLNWVRQLTGKGAFGDFAVSGLGRVFGRSDRDIKAFGGIGRKKVRGVKDPNFTTIAAGPIKPLKRGDASADILAKMYNFMKMTDEDRKLKFEIDKTFKQEQIDEENRRHKALVDAILKYKNSVGGEGVTEAEKEKSWWDKVPDLFKSAITPMLPLAAAAVGGGILLGGAAASYFAAGVLATEGASSLREGSTSTPMAGALAGDTALASGILDPGLYDRQKEQESKDKKLKKLAGEFDKTNDITKVRTEALEAKKQLLVDYGYEGSRFRMKKGNGDKEDAVKAKLLDDIDAEIIKRKSGSKVESPTAKPAPVIDEVKPTAKPITKSEENTNVPTQSVAQNTQNVGPVSIPNTTSNNQNIPAAIPVQNSANVPVPQQLNEEQVVNNNAAPVVSVNNSTKTINGSEPKVVQTATARTRNIDIEKYNRNISVAV